MAKKSKKPVSTSTRKHKPTPKRTIQWRIPLLVLGGLLLLGSGFLFGAAQMENRDSFCASCHSEPETTYVDRTQAAAPVDLASQHHVKAARCIDCHSGPCVTGRIGAEMQGATDLVAWVTKTARQPAVLTNPIHDQNCIKCHADVPNTTDFQRHFHAFLSRWQAMDSQAATCVDCHTAHTTDGQASLTFLNEQRAVAVCQRCHAALGGG